MNEDQFWHLLAKKLSNEASIDEQEELNELLHKNPALKKTADSLASFWKLSPNRKEADSEIVFEKLWEKINCTSGK